MLDKVEVACVLIDNVIADIIFGIAHNIVAFTSIIKVDLGAEIFLIISKIIAPFGGTGPFMTKVRFEIVARFNAIHKVRIFTMLHLKTHIAIIDLANSGFNALLCKFGFHLFKGGQNHGFNKFHHVPTTRINN